MPEASSQQDTSLSDLLIANEGEIVDLRNEIDQEIFPDIPSIEEIQG